MLWFRKIQRNSFKKNCIFVEKLNDGRNVMVIHLYCLWFQFSRCIYTDNSRYRRSLLLFKRQLIKVVQWSDNRKRVHLYWDKSQNKIDSRWVHRESRLMFRDCSFPAVFGLLLIFLCCIPCNGWARALVTLIALLSNLCNSSVTNTWVMWMIQ